MKLHETDPAHATALYKPVDDLKHDPSVFLDQELWTRKNTLQYTAYAARTIARRPWRRSDMDAEEYVSEAKVLLITGQRRYTTRYSPKRCVFATLAGLIYHGGFEPENVIPHASLTTFATDEWGLLDESMLPAAANPDIVETIAARDLVEKFKSNFDNEAHRRYLDVLADGYVNAADAAMLLSVPEAEIWKYRKVIRRPRAKWPGRPPRD